MFTIVIPQIPESIKTKNVTRITIVVSLNNLCLNLLCEASWDKVAPKIHQVKKHSLAAHIQD